MIERLDALIASFQSNLDTWDTCQECGMVEQETVDLLKEVRDRLVSLGG